MYCRIIWLPCLQQIEMLLRFLEVLGGNQQIREIQTRVIVIGVQLQRASELLVGSRGFADAQIREREMVVRLCEPRIDLDRVAVLDGSLAVPRFLVVPLPAFEILL